MPFFANSIPAYLGSDPLPAINPPPLKYINTGYFLPFTFACAHILRYRQSSLLLFAQKFISPKRFRCVGSGPNSLAGRTPFQDASPCGAFQRRLPTGGAANGTPRNTCTPDSIQPSSIPLLTFTRGPVCAFIPNVITTDAKKRKTFFTIKIDLIYDANIA